jgi:hypothetical protein
MNQDLSQLLQSALSGDVMSKLTDLTDGNQDQTKTATQGAISAIMAAMSKNAKSSDGAQQIAQAVGKDHDGSILEDVAGHLFGDKGNSRMLNGEGILKHVLGGKQTQVAQGLSQETGLSKDSIMQLLVKVAPLVMGALGKQQKESSGGLDLGNLAGMLMSGAKTQAPQSSTMSMLSSFLDQDGDGDMMDDVGNMLGGFFK